MGVIQKIWLSDDAINILTADGKEAKELLSDYPRLKNATRQQLEAYISDEYGIHWPDLDEDLEFESFFKAKTHTELYHLFSNHPELNASAIAKRMGISQSLFAQYISGKKTPSKKRLKQIFSCLKEVGREISDMASALGG